MKFHDSLLRNPKLQVLYFAAHAPQAPKWFIQKWSESHECLIGQAEAEWAFQYGLRMADKISSVNPVEPLPKMPPIGLGEGRVSKGGLGTKPTTPHPPAPKGQGGREL